MSNTEWVVPLSLSSALALGMDEASAKLAVQLQQQDLGRLDRPIIMDSIPNCEPKKVADEDTSETQNHGAQNCIVCLVEDVHVRLACGHAVLCEECSLSIRNMEAGATKCPLCRKYGSIVDSGAHINLQESYVDPTKITKCDGCKVKLQSLFMFKILL